MAFGKDRAFRPLPGRYGAQVVTVSRLVPTLTANTTTTINVGAPVGDSRRTEKCKLLGVAVSAITPPADADGTILASVIKRDVSASSDVTLSSATLDLETLTAETQADFSLVEDDSQLTFDAGDILEVDVVNNSVAIDTQPGEAIIVAEFALLH